MALKEMPLKTGEQLTFVAIELGETVREIERIEIAKKEANEEWAIELKALKKRMFKLAHSLGKDAKSED